MSQQTELTCVSCDTAFDPGPTGGFCPECDTPHPDFEHETPDESETGTEATGEAADGAATGKAGSGGAAAADASSAPAATDAGADDGTVPAYCPDCGTSLAEATGDATGADVWDCPDCGRAVTDESYCPDCGTDLEAARADAEADAPAASTDDAASAAAGDGAGDDVEEAETEIAGEPAATSAGAPETVTLVVNGEPYAFGDGDTFGREDDAWLEDLVKAAGGSDALSYISSEHVEFSIEDDGVYVTDVSRNGTMLNGRDLDGGRAEVEDGDYLTLAGRAEVQLKL